MKISSARHFRTLATSFLLVAYFFSLYAVAETASIVLGPVTSETLVEQEKQILDPQGNPFMDDHPIDRLVYSTKSDLILLNDHKKLGTFIGNISLLKKDKEFYITRQRYSFMFDKAFVQSDGGVPMESIESAIEFRRDDIRDLALDQAEFLTFYQEHLVPAVMATFEKRGFTYDKDFSISLQDLFRGFAGPTIQRFHLIVQELVKQFEQMPGSLDTTAQQGAAKPRINGPLATSQTSLPARVDYFDSKGHQITAQEYNEISSWRRLFEKIRVGMTTEEVESLLGKPTQRLVKDQESKQRILVYPRGAVYLNENKVTSFETPKSPTTSIELPPAAIKALGLDKRAMEDIKTLPKMQLTGQARLMSDPNYKSWVEDLSRREQAKRDAFTAEYLLHHKEKTLKVLNLIRQMEEKIKFAQPKTPQTYELYQNIGKLKNELAELGFYKINAETKEILKEKASLLANQERSTV